MDASNYCLRRDRYLAELDSGPVASSQQFQKQLPASKVVKR